MEAHESVRQNLQIMLMEESVFTDTGLLCASKENGEWETDQV